MFVINKLDPRINLLVFFMFTVLVFFVNRLPVIIFVMFFFAIIRLAAKVPFREKKYIKNLTLLALFIILIQILFGPGENYIVRPLFPQSFPFLGGMGSLKWDGLILGLVIVCRISALMILFPVFAEFTPSHRLAMGFHSLGFNYRAAFIITTTFNLIPFFIEESRVIMDAQKMRGMRFFEQGSFFARLKAYPGLALPLVLGAMRKAQASSVAMDSRAFGVYKTRTWLDKPQMKIYDYLLLAFCIIFFAGILFLNYLF
jgi:energy-coupling factor transporter transmembrane protein EcfT